MTPTHEEIAVHWAEIPTYDNQRCVVAATDQEYLTGVISYLWMNETVKAWFAREKSQILVVKAPRASFIIGESAGILRHEFERHSGFYSFETMHMTAWLEYDYTVADESWLLDGTWIGSSHSFKPNKNKWPEMPGGAK